MKKILLFVLFIFLLANVAACGKQEGNLVPPSFDSGAVLTDRGAAILKIMEDERK